MEHLKLLNELPSIKYLLCITLAIALSTLPAIAVGCPNAPTANPGGMVAPSLHELRLDRRIEELLAGIPVTPGLAVGVVRGDEVVYARGFGYRDLETCAPVTDNTLFYLLSVTKSFTGMLAAQLAHEGTLELDQSLAHYFPDLTMPAPINPAQTSLRDLLLHRSGFWNGGINYRTYAPGNLDSEGILHLLEHHSRPLPITFRYSNMGYVIAGSVFEKVTGETWRDLLEKKLFIPLEMNATTAYIERATSGEFAFPTTLSRTGDFVRLPPKQEPQMHAAGGMVSNVQDLLRWVRFNLHPGRLDGQQVLSARVVRQAQAPQIQYDWTYYRYRRFAYGLGVHNADYEGDLLIHHFGGPIHVSFMPEHELGVVVLTSGKYSTSLSHLLAAWLYDLLLHKEDVEAKYAREVAEVKASTFERVERFHAEEAELLAGCCTSPMARPLTAYAGHYSSDRLGTMVVHTDGGRLLLKYGVLSAEMLPLQEPDAFLVYLQPGELPLRFDFRTNADEEPATIDWGGRLFERQR